MIALMNAHLCQDCQLIGDNPSHCNYCQSKSLLSLASVLNRQSSRSVEIECSENQVKITVK